MDLTIDQALQKAVEAHKVGQIQEADRLYTAILKSRPRHPDANHNLGVLAVSVGKAQDALPFFLTALEANPSIAQFWISYIDTLIKLDRPSDAKTVFDQAKSKGVKGDAFRSLETRLAKIEVAIGADKAHALQELKQTDILDGLKLDQAVNLAKKKTKEGFISEARSIYDEILTKYPKNKRAIKGLKSLQAKNLVKTSYVQDPPQDQLQSLINLYNQGQLQHAFQQSKLLVITFPKSAILFNIQGVLLKDLGQLELSIEAYRKALSIKPDYAEVHNNMGVTLQEQRNLKEAIKAFLKALAIMPDYADAHYNMGNALKDQGKLEEAREAYNKALAVKPDYAEAHNNVGNTLKDDGKLKEAIEAYKKALAIKPDYAEAHNNMGNSFKEQSRLEEAIVSYNKALAIKPDYAEAYYNMGNAFKEQGKLEEVREAYSKALAIKPDYAEAHNNMGNVLKDQGKLKEAMVSFEKALSLKHDYAEPYFNIGDALYENGKLDKAVEAYIRALSIKPANVYRAQKLHVQAHMCDWLAMNEDLASLKALGIDGQAVSPFQVFSLEDVPERHQLRSELYARENFRQKPLPLPGMPSKKPDKLRIGYFSTDYGEHPVAYLIAKVLEQHNRNEFEVFGYSLHGNQQDELRQRLVDSFDRFVDVQKLSNKDVALKARQDGIDIAIDLNGYTQNSRTKIFAYRAAPIQINYLGFPGTTGADFMDYIVADRHVIPPENQKYFNEKILYLPNTYMPTDNGRELSEKHMTRRDMGLPEDAFVFCCFNNNYKITGLEFDIWMRLLNNVEGSVLWLRQSNEWSELNIKKEAQRRKVDPERVVFAGRIPIAEHLARQRLADLFIDTFSFNAHTTATEALWASLPVVTKTGQGFAARVAGSLLNSVGLPELITKNEHDYEMLILELATNPSKLSKVRKKLAANLLEQPLFDTEQYTKHLEDGYKQAYQNYFEGNTPATITLQK